MNPRFQLSRAVSVLLITTLAFFMLQFVPGIGSWLWNFGAFVPGEVFGKGEIWRLGTYMFLHSTATVFHFLLNMMGLWMFGSELEERWGARRFLFFYALCGIGAALFGVFYLFGPVARYVQIVGASGAVFGILTAYAVYYPNREVLLFFVIPVRVWILVTGYAALSLLFAFSEQGGVVAHLVHFGGIAVAFGCLKGGPVISRWTDEARELLNEQAMRARAEESVRKKRYFEETIDPLLEKISREGIKSLTKEERRILRDAGKNGKELLKKKKIIPFDAFRKGDTER